MFEQRSAAAVIEALDQFHAAAQKVFVGYLLFCPAVEHLIESRAFHAAKLLVAEVGVVNHLRDSPHSTITNGKLLAQGLKGAILLAMTKSLWTKHIERHGRRMCFRIVGENKPCLRINESLDQPCRRNAIDPRARPRNPNPVTVLRCLG